MRSYVLRYPKSDAPTTVYVQDKKEGATIRFQPITRKQTVYSFAYNRLKEPLHYLIATQGSQKRDTKLP